MAESNDLPAREGQPREIVLRRASGGGMMASDPIAQGSGGAGAFSLTDYAASRRRAIAAGDLAGGMGSPLSTIGGTDSGLDLTLRDGDPLAPGGSDIPRPPIELDPPLPPMEPVPDTISPPREGSLTDTFGGSSGGGSDGITLPSAGATNFAGSLTDLLENRDKPAGTCSSCGGGSASHISEEPFKVNPELAELDVSVSSRAAASGQGTLVIEVIEIPHQLKWSLPDSAEATDVELHQLTVQAIDENPIYFSSDRPDEIDPPSAPGADFPGIDTEDGWREIHDTVRGKSPRSPYRGPVDKLPGDVESLGEEERKKGNQAVSDDPSDVWRRTCRELAAALGKKSAEWPLTGLSDFEVELWHKEVRNLILAYDQLNCGGWKLGRPEGEIASLCDVVEKEIEEHHDSVPPLGSPQEEYEAWERKWTRLVDLASVYCRYSKRPLPKSKNGLKPGFVPPRWLAPTSVSRARKMMVINEWIKRMNKWRSESAMQYIVFRIDTPFSLGSVPTLPKKSCDTLKDFLSKLENFFRTELPCSRESGVEPGEAREVCEELKAYYQRIHKEYERIYQLTCARPQQWGEGEFAVIEEKLAISDAHRDWKRVIDWVVIGKSGESNLRILDQLLRAEFLESGAFNQFIFTGHGVSGDCDVGYTCGTEDQDRPANDLVTCALFGGKEQFVEFVEILRGRIAFGGKVWFRGCNFLADFNLDNMKYLAKELGVEVCSYCTYSKTYRYYANHVRGQIRCVRFDVASGEFVVTDDDEIDLPHETPWLGGILGF